MEKHIIIDIMGGDYAPSEILKGIQIAEKETEGVKFVLVGDMTKAKPYLWESDNLIFHDIKHEKEDEYKIKRKSVTSISEGIELTKKYNNSVFLSAANTGKVVAEAFLRLGRVKGVERPAIAVILPGIKSPTVLLDVGANSDCRVGHMEHFAVLGSVYAELLLEKAKPRIGLLNIGSEKSKGNKFYGDVYEKFSNNEQINFAGNIEPNTLVLEDEADVVVCDGFTGNIVLKSMEGISYLALGAMLQSKIPVEYVEKLKAKLDYQEYGGAMLLGVNGQVVITHGVSKAKAISSAIKFASVLAQNKMLDKVKIRIDEFNNKKSNCNNEEE
ncbi:MAG: phosphate acyltransferase PlsX [Candidatus Muirbacterium halophilum]|nr:phosphate acyltransferase PlsX [Candidatus Muirbacterium halophilum]MCK9477036.1 phosphate acyltransferase PlsX [Candidatus Muirbacterium halophilum]